MSTTPQADHAGRLPHPYPDDEIRLADLWFTLARRKYVILGCLVAALLAAAGVSVFMSPRYESRAVIVVGKVADELLESPELLGQRLKLQYRVDDPDVTPEPPFLSEVVLEAREPKAVLTLKALGTSPEQAREFLHGVVEQVLAEHQARYSRRQGLSQVPVDTLKEAIARVEAQVARMKGNAQASQAEDASTAVIRAMERGRLLSELSQMKEQQAALELSLLPPSTEPTRLLLEPTLAEDPKRPRPKLYTALALVLGLFGGVMAAFVWEAVARVREQVNAGPGGG